MVDPDRVYRLLRGVDERLGQLRSAGADGADVRPQSMWLHAVKYLFVTAIEGCIDVAHHLAASERWASPDTNAASFRLLGDHGVLDAPTASAMARAAGFRNVLVHQYIEVDDERVVAFLGELGVLDEFVRQVDGWLAAPERAAQP